LGFWSEIHPHDGIDGKLGPLIAAKIRCACQAAIGKCHDCDCQGIAVQVIHRAKYRRCDFPAESGRRNLRVRDEAYENLPAAGQQ